jgi:hypothetical protein
MPLYSNGRAPASALVNIFGCVASPDMARRVAATKRDYEREVGGVLIVNEIYRTYDEQVRQKARWTALGFPGNAAAPGYSNHGNWDVGAVDWSSDNIGARRSIAARYGLIHDIANESWHATKHNEGTHPLPELADFSFAGLQPTPIPEDMMNADQQATLDAIAWTVGQIKPQTDKLGRIAVATDLVLWATTDPTQGLRQMVANLSELVVKLDRDNLTKEQADAALAEALAPFTQTTIAVQAVEAEKRVESAAAEVAASQLVKD